MVFDSKLKINSYHEYFPDTLEKYTRFLKFISISVLVMYVSMERLYAAMFAAAFFPSWLFVFLQCLSRFQFKRFIWIVL